MQKPLPYITAESSEFFKGCKEGKLLYQHCLDCERNQFYPRFQCKQCSSKNLEYRESKGTGIIYTYSVVHRAPNPAFKEDVPYVLALVELDEGFRMMSNIIGTNEVKIGDRVLVEFEKRSEEIYIPQFRQMLTFEKIKVGQAYGSSTYECGPEKVEEWNAIYQDPTKQEKKPTIVPLGMSGIIVMNTYDVTLKGRPPGNVHGAQNFQIHRPIQIGETVNTTLSIEDKFIKKERKWVFIKTETHSENGTLLLEGRMNILWSE